MIYILFNALPILPATAAGLVVGALYVRLRAPRGGLSRGRIDLALAGTAAVAEGWLCCILAGALILAPPQAGAWTMAIGSAVVIWIGFVAPAVLVTERFRKTPWADALLDSGHWLAVMVVQAVVLHAVGLSRPA